MRVFVPVFFSLLILCSCKDNNGCMSVKPESEEAAIVAYAAANGINATKHTSGLYYEIINHGSGVTPNANSKVWITYTGKHMNGNIFFQTTTSIYIQSLGGAIEGLKIGLQLIQKGGKIKLVIPSSMAYGCAGSENIIASNEILYYEVDLVDVQ